MATKAYFVPKTRGDTARERQRRKGRLREETKQEQATRRKARAASESSRLAQDDAMEPEA